MMRWISVCTLLLLLPLLGQCTHDPPFELDGTWRDRLYAPTMLDRVGDYWFLVDAFHNRILASDTLSYDLSEWDTLTENVIGPHSVATDGDLYLYEDTGRGNLQAAVQVYLNEDFAVTETNSIPGMGSRPHRTVYDEPTERFYTIASTSQEYIRIRNENGYAVEEHRFHAPFLEGVYSRSITIIDDRMFTVSSNGRITETTYRDGLYEVQRVYRLPAKFGAMIDMFRSSNGWYYLSAKPEGFGRARTLEGFETGDYEDLYSKIGLKGTPYYLTEVEGRIVVPFQEASNGILTFQEDGAGEIINIEVLWDFGPPPLTSLIRKLSLTP